MPRGGAREGAGRPSTREKFARPVAAAEKQIADRLPDILAGLLDLALGVTVQEVDKEGGTNVFTRPPDFKAGSYLVDRILGKPTQPQEVSGPGGKPVEVKVSAATQKAASEQLKVWQQQMKDELANMLSVPPTAPTSSTTS